MNNLNNTVNLALENQRYVGTGGISQECHQLNFLPAFIDRASGQIELSRFANGIPATFHCLNGLPEEWIIQRNDDGSVAAVKPGIESGFYADGKFYTRAEAANLISLL